MTDDSNEENNAEDFMVHIIKVPFSEAGLGKTKGTEKAPNRIMDELGNFYLKERTIKSDEKETMLNFEAEGIYFDVDEVVPVKGNIDSTNRLITSKVREKSGKVVCLGGDHNVTYGAFTGFIEREDVKGKEPALIFLDAHPDVLPSSGLSTHEDFLRQLIEENKVKPENIIMFGIRAADVTEKQFLDKYGIEVITMEQIFENGVKTMTEVLMEFAAKKEAIYFSLDIDVVDPSAAPATGYLEPGGLSSRELIYVVQKLSHLKNLKQMDILEINPDMDLNDMTSRLAAKCLKECW